MSEPESRVASWVGPFLAGSPSSDLMSLAQPGDSGIRVLTREERQRDYYKARCDTLASLASEFFFDYDHTSSLIFQKTRDTANLPDFVEYIYCWLAEDRLCGLILSGVTSDAGTHEQMDHQEAAFWDHTVEVAEALSLKYAENPDSIVNYFNFGAFSELPELAGALSTNCLTGYQRLVRITENNEPLYRIETHYCGPSLIRCAPSNHDSNLSTPAASSRQPARRFFASPDFFVVYDVKIERYVRTIESIHVYENLIYIARKLADDLGRNLNSRRCALIQAQAQAEIDQWNESISRAAEARTERIRRLAEIL